MWLTGFHCNILLGTNGEDNSNPNLHFERSPDRE